MTISLDNSGNATIDIDTDNVLGYDDTEENQDANDLAVLVDEDDRGSSINEESEIPSYQKPWIKLAVLGTVIGGIGLSAATLYTISQSRVASIATAAKPDEVKGLGFAEGGDADKTAIALNSQNGQFKPSSQESPPPSTGQETKPATTPSPTPSVAASPPIVSAPKPAQSVAAPPVAPPPTPKVSTAKASPIAPTPPGVQPLKPKDIPVASKPNNEVKPVAPPKVAAIPAKEKSVLDKPSNVIKPVAPPKPVDQPVALKTNAKPVSVPVEKPVEKPIKKDAPVATAPVAPLLSPEQQWLAMSRSGTFGNAANAGGTEVKPQEQEIATAIPQPAASNNIDGTPTVKIARVNPAIGNSKSVDPVINLRQPQGDLISEAPPPLPNPAIPEEKKDQSEIQANPNNLLAASLKNADKVNTNLGNGGTLVAYNGVRRFRIDTQGDEAQPQQNVPAPAPISDGILPSEQKVINGVAIRSYRIPVGTQLKGTVLTPVQASTLDASGASPVGSIVAIRLDAPLKDPSGRLIIPSENTQIIFTFEVRNGWVVATSKTLIVNGQKTDIEGLLTMQGNSGQPLIAETYRPGAAEVDAADRNLLLWGAVAGAGEAATQGQTTVTLGNGGTVVQNTGGQNILGGILKGAGTPYVQAQQERAKAASLAAAARQPIYYVTPGSKVDVFFMGQLDINN